EAGPNAFARDGLAAGANCDANLGAVEGGGLAGLPVRPDASRVECLAVPAVIPEDTVRFCYDVPPLEVAQRVPLACTRPDVHLLGPYAQLQFRRSKRCSLDLCAVLERGKEALAVHFWGLGLPVGFGDLFFHQDIKRRATVTQGSSEIGFNKRPHVYRFHCFND